MKIASTWRDMLPKLITKYHDGYRAITDGDLPAVEMQRLFYPAWWLKAVGFFNSGINTGPGVIMFAPNPLGSSTADGSGGWAMALLATAVVSSALSFCVAYLVFSKTNNAALMGGEKEVTVIFHAPSSQSSASSVEGVAPVPLSYQSQLLQPMSTRNRGEGAGVGRSKGGRQYASGDIQLAPLSTSTDGKRSVRSRRTEYMSLDV